MPGYSVWVDVRDFGISLGVTILPKEIVMEISRGISTEMHKNDKFGFPFHKIKKKLVIAEQSREICKFRV